MTSIGSKRLWIQVVFGGAIMMGITQGFAQKHEAYPSAFPDGPFAHLNKETTLSELAYITPDKATHPIEIYDLDGSHKGTTKKYYALFYRYWTFFIYELPPIGQREVTVWNLCFSLNKTIPAAGLPKLPWDLTKLESQTGEQAVMNSFNGKWLSKFPSGNYTAGEVVPYGAVPVDAVSLYDFTHFTELQMLYFLANYAVVSSVWSEDKAKAWKCLMPSYDEGWKEFEPGGRYFDEGNFLLINEAP
ncbi:MAG: hypothetical protein LBU03_05360 [Tannerellaceae bacterium]|jgi:hypothetical protein|nr:hypothetical protein [Tannerellaceae bacterium]